MTVNPNPPATPIKVTSNYHATGALPTIAPAKLEPAAFPGQLPKSLGAVKDVGNMNTYKAAALDGADATKTFHAIGGFEQAVAAASLLAAKATGNAHGDMARGTTRSYAVLASGGDFYVTPLWAKNPLPDGTRVGFDVDWSEMRGANEGRGTAAKAADPIFAAAVGATRWIDVRSA